MTIIDASVFHAAAMAAIHADAVAHGEQWSEVAIRALLAQPTTLGLVAGDAGFILVRCVADEAEILMLAVASLDRRRGIGHALLLAGVAAARQRGAAAMFLEVDAANEPARALYAAEGFAPIGRRRDYYADGRDAVVLRLSLAPRTIAVRD